MLSHVQVVRYEAPPGSEFTHSGHLAVIDTLISAFSDAFVGTRHSMFTWNIFEERLLQGHASDTNSYM